jgi:hypothetical protein
MPKSAILWPNAALRRKSPDRQESVKSNNSGLQIRHERERQFFVFVRLCSAVRF